MTDEELFDNLCTKDRRNPFWQDLYGFDDEPPEPRVDCSCDNCFYGRDKLALEIIKLREQAPATSSQEAT